MKGLALRHPEELTLERFGVLENRRFYIVDADCRRFGQLRCGPLVQIGADYHAETDRLTLTFPDGTVVEGEVALGESVTTDFHGRDVEGRVVAGPWNDALSTHMGRPLRIVKSGEPGAAVDRARGSVSLLSDASVLELGRRAGVDVDDRRFRMLIRVDGCAAHEEDEWVGGSVRVGDATIVVNGFVARCAITTQNPEHGSVDFDTLREIKAYRGVRDGGIDFGVFGEVVEPGRVRLGDTVEPL